MLTSDLTQPCKKDTCAEEALVYHTTWQYLNTGYWYNSILIAVLSYCTGYHALYMYLWVHRLDVCLILKYDVSENHWITQCDHSWVLTELNTFYIIIHCTSESRQHFCQMIGPYSTYTVLPFLENSYVWFGLQWDIIYWSVFLLFLPVTVFMLLLHVHMSKQHSCQMVRPYFLSLLQCTSFSFNFLPLAWPQGEMSCLFQLVMVYFSASPGMVY